jgi:hypothetical protein
MEDVRKALGKIPPFRLPGRVIGPMEQQLKDEFEKQKDIVGENFEEFRKKRLAEIQKAQFGFALPPEEADKQIEEVKKQGGHAGEEAGKQYSKAAGKSVQELDAVLFGSAESFRRVTSYFETLGQKTAGKKEPGGQEPGKAPARVMIEQEHREIVDGKLQITKLARIEDVLLKIADNTKAGGNVQIEGADLG